MIIAVRYDYDPEQDLSIVRPAHRQFLRGLLDAGSLLASGPLPRSNGALIILSGDSPEAALQLLEADPFLAAGCILRRTAEEWDPVLGVLAPKG
ncbi:MAG: hypothetical protein GX427_13360 [Actinomycetales bacterium]|jgi:Uncharacterized protein conserved in bacteria|nr:hypothetical protein [Actinomycetales bacterium]